MGKRIIHLRLPHPTWDPKVEAVKDEMRVLGPPIIRVVDCGDYYMAIEGCHRLMAAALLDIAPRLQILAPDEALSSDSLDGDYPPGQTYTAREIAEDNKSHHNPCLVINPDGTLTILPKVSHEEE
jgi:hypothetical protein